MLVPGKLCQTTGVKCKDSVEGKAAFSIYKIKSHKVGKNSSMKERELA
jgi:hypothetical protein